MSDMDLNKLQEDEESDSSIPIESVLEYAGIKLSQPLPEMEDSPPEEVNQQEDEIPMNHINEEENEESSDGLQLEGRFSMRRTTGRKKTGRRTTSGKRRITKYNSRPSKLQEIAKKYYLWYVLGALLIGLIIFLSTFYGIKSYVSTKVEESEIKVSNIEVTNINNEGADLVADFEIITDSTYEATFTITQDKIKLLYGNSKLGYLIPLVKNFSANEVGKFEGSIEVSSESLYQDTILCFTNQDKCSMKITTDIELSASVITLEEFIAKKFEAEGLNGFSPIINEYAISGGNDKQFRVETNFSVSSPSTTKVEVPAVVVSVHKYPNKIGEVELPGFTLTKGKHDMSVNVSINSEGLIDEFISEEELEFQIRGEMNIEGLVPFRIFLTTITVKGMNGLPYSYTPFYVNKEAENLTLSTNITFDNPCNVSIDIYGIGVDLYYDNCLIEYVELSGSNFNLIEGENIIEIELSIEPERCNILDSFINDETIQIDFNASALPNITSSIHLFSDSISLNAMNGLPYELKDFEIIRGGLNYLEVGVNVSLNNPSDIEANFDSILIDIFYDSRFVGNQSQSLYLNKGNNDFYFKLNVSDDKIVDDFIFNSSLTFDYKVSISVPDKYEIITDDFLINGLNDPFKQMNEFILADSTEEGFILNVSAQINNPSDIDFIIDSIIMEINYQSLQIGNGSIYQIDFSKGNHEIDIEATLGGHNDNKLKSFIRDYITKPGQILQMEALTHINLNKFDDDYIVDLNISIDIDVPNVDLIVIDRLDPLSLSYSEGNETGEFVMDVYVEVTNPMNFPINTTSFDGPATYNDTDGFDLYIYNWGPANDIWIDDIHMDNWESEPFELQANEIKEDFAPIGTNNLTNVLRLWDENNKLQLYVDIKNATLGVQIGKFDFLIDYLYFMGLYVKKIV